MQLRNKYILTHIKSGLIIIDQQRAHERILFEKAMDSLERQSGTSQQQLFPQSVELTGPDFALIMELKDDLHRLGFTLDSFGGNAVVVNGVPTDAMGMSVQGLIEDFLEQYKHFVGDMQSDSRERLARSMARSLGMKEGKALQPVEMIDLIDQLFACEQPYAAPNGKPTILTFTIEDLNRQFKA
jgi:DNA mismatch repair protein MutL